MVLIHRAVGYPTAFIIAPLALLAFARPELHRLWGKIYFCSMIFLYLTGSWFTITRHEWSSWDFFRNLSFNFFGFSMLLYAYRSIRLFRREGNVVPDRWDRFLAQVLTASVVFLFLVAIRKSTAMRVFTLIGAWLCLMEWRELRSGVFPKPLLFRRHQRYVLASYFYVLTVVSVVHLNDELPTNVRWLWPSLAGIFVVWLLTGNAGARKGIITRRVVWGVFSLSMLYGSYVAYDLLYGSTLQGQG